MQYGIPFGCVNENTCDVQLGCISFQISSAQLKATYYVLTTLDLDRVAEFTQRKKKL
jgi:hypothetical protein